MNTDIWTQCNIAHILWCNENKLFLDRMTCSLNLPINKPISCRRYHHRHTGLTIHRIHKHVTTHKYVRQGMRLQFVQRTDRRSHGLPHRQKHANLRKRLFSTGKRFRIFPGSTFAIATRIDFNSNLHFLVIKDEFSLESALFHQVTEYSDGFMTDNLAEPEITILTFTMRFPEDLEIRQVAR